MAVDFKSLGKYEQGALVAGGVSLIVSFFTAYVKASFDGGKDLGISVSSGISAWHSYATLGILLVIAATAVVAVKAFAKDVLPDGVPWNLVALAAAGLGTLLLILRAFTVGGGGGGVSVGPGWSGYLLFLTTIALTVFTFLSFRESGEKLPEMPKKGDTPPAPPAPPTV